jgi:hypothetical protein
MAGAALLAALIATPAMADVYTWVDASGNVNVSNLAPPAGARVTAVAHESAGAAARAEAARKAAQEAEVRALSERVAELENAAQASRMAPPVYGPPPGMIAAAPYAAPPPAPRPQFVVTTMPSEDYDASPPGYACAWAGCPLPFAGGYYAPIVVVPPLFNHRHDRHGRRDHVAPAPHVVGTPARPPRMTRRG